MAGAAAWVHAQPAPIADQPEQALLPAGISELPLSLNAKLAYLFKESDGTEVVHLLGDAELSLGTVEGQRLSAREAVIWISNQKYENRPYRHLDVFLWREAQVEEIGGTQTLAPVLFVSLDTSGPISTAVDEFAFESSAKAQAYLDGQSIREALAARREGKPIISAPLRVFDPSGLSTPQGPPEPPPVIHFQSTGEFKGPIEHEGHRLVTVIGRVYLARGVPATDQFLEIQADSAVVFLSPEGTAPRLEAIQDDGLGGKEREPATGTKDKDAKPRRKKSPGNRQMLSAGIGDLDVEGAYLEGDVIMTVGPNMIRASRLYYDFLDNRALILDAVVRTIVPQRNIPLYVRAAEIRQLTTNHFSAEDALLTTSEFHTPHYHIGAKKVEIINRTPPVGARGGLVAAGSFRIEDSTLNVGGIPIAYWPSVKGTLDVSETAIRNVRAGYSDDFGAEFETEWNLFSLAGLEQPEGFDASLSLDYFSERGPAIGIDADYERESYFGLMRSYLIHDSGEDSVNADQTVPPPDELRGRFLARHRDYLADDWQLTLELSYISDRNFLKEYFESEFENEKEQETLAYLKKQRDNWAFSGQLQFRILDFTTQTERLPDFSYYRIGEPLSVPARLRPALDNITWFTENRLGLVRYRPAEQTFEEWLENGNTNSSDTTFRADTRQELTRAFDLGPWRMVPFTAVRGTTWSDSIDEHEIARAMAVYGVRGSTYLSRLYPESRSAFWDIDGIRHVIKADVTAWASQANVGSDELYLFDETVEGIDPIDGVSAGIRQRWQTKRGQGANRRKVDVVTVDTEIGAFSDTPGEDVTNGFMSYSRPENSIARNYVSNAVIWRMNDRTTILNELNYDLNDGDLAVANVSVAVERTPRFSYLIGYRFIDYEESNLLGFDLNYRMTEKHTIALRNAFDLDQGRNLDFTVALIRKHPRWFSAWSFEIDEAEDDFGVSFSLWPEGLEQAAIGSRRFTGLASTTRLSGDEP